MAIDKRIIKIGITINGKVEVVEGLAITAQGSKFASATQNETLIKIANLSKSAREFLATEGTPFNRVSNRPRQQVYIEAGRESKGVTRIFSGDITLVTLSQPPDIWTTIKAVTNQFKKGEIISTNEASVVSLSNIAKKAADAAGVALQFEADDLQVSSYGYTGSAAKQIDKVGELGPLDAYIDDDTMVVKNSGAPLSGATRTISAETGMIGKPEFTDFGVRVSFLLDIQAKIGEKITTISKVYPASNGTYVIYKLDFDIANRDTPFYYTAEARRI
tara:strand:- start:12270 stop:13094 length:825 start_codon:yes stop_codon:yes gene_type:complete